MLSELIGKTHFYPGGYLQTIPLLFNFILVKIV